MKRKALIAALLILLGCLSACMPTKNTASQTTPSATIEPPEQTTLPQDTSGPDIHPTQPPEVSLSQIPLASIATPIVTEAFCADNGTVILNYTYQHVFLIYSDVAVADALYLSMVNAMDYSIGLQDALAQAKEAYEEDPENWTAYSYSVLFDTARIDQSVISTVGEVCADTGDASSITVSSSFSLIDGRRLSFGDIQGKRYHYYDLLKLIDTQLQANIGKDLLFNDYQETIASQLRSKDCTNWYFTETGLCFYYLPMEIAPNSEGTIVVEVPYSALQGLLKDDYFPAEDYITGGTMYGQLFSDAELFQYKQFAEAIQSDSGVEILLGTDGAVTDIRLEYGGWNKAGTEFAPTATIFACDGISADSAIVVQCDIPDVMPVLRLTYVSKGISYSRYITQSGKDGSIILTE